MSIKTFYPFLIYFIEIMQINLVLGTLQLKQGFFFMFY